MGYAGAGVRGSRDTGAKYSPFTPDSLYHLLLPPYHWLTKPLVHLLQHCGYHLANGRWSLAQKSTYEVLQLRLNAEGERLCSPELASG